MTETTEWADLDEGLDLDEFEAKVGSGFVRVPAGTYTATVKGVEGKTSKKDAPYMVFSYEITSEGEFNGAEYQEWMAFTDKGKPYIKGRFVSLGCDDSPGTKYTKDDVIGVDVVLVLRSSPNAADPANPYVNVDTVTLATPASVSAKPVEKKAKTSGGNLFGN